MHLAPLPRSSHAHMTCFFIHSSCGWQHRGPVTLLTSAWIPFQTARVGRSCDFAGAVPGQEAIHVLDPPRTVILVKHRADTVRHPLRVARIHVELAQSPAALIGDGDGYLDRPW